MSSVSWQQRERTSEEVVGLGGDRMVRLSGHAVRKIDALLRIVPVWRGSDVGAAVTLARQ